MDANVTVDYASYFSGKMSMHLGKEDYTTTIIIKSLLLPAETIKRKFAWVNIFIKFPSRTFVIMCIIFVSPAFSRTQAAFMS